MEQIKQRIAVGDWPPNTLLPSVRELATETKLSIITVKRAYLELGREGVIITQQGKGSWVSDTLDLATVQKQELIQHLEQASKLAKSLAIPEDKILQLIKQFME
ncbi:MAG: GntR family transcriptional regulator [Undibacterium umbellatum]